MTETETTGDSRELAEGRQLGRYRLEYLLGAGCMGAVWAAHDEDLDRHVANHPASAMALLDRWATSWVETYDANCSHPEDVEFGARRLCLEAQRDDLGIMFADLTAAARGIQRAELGRVRPSPVACARDGGADVVITARAPAVRPAPSAKAIRIRDASIRWQVQPAIRPR